MDGHAPMNSVYDQPSDFRLQVTAALAWLRFRCFPALMSLQTPSRGVLQKVHRRIHFAVLSDQVLQKWQQEQRPALGLSFP